MLRYAGIILILAALIAAKPSRAQQDSGSFTVGTASAAPGEKATGFIHVPADVDAALDVPVVVINGTKPGPVLAIVAGSHGTEYASIIAVEKMIQHADPKQISGTLILVPLLNVNSFLQKVPHLNPVDHKNMNRMYPGNPNGTQTDRASWAITKDVVEKCDYLIDMHGGDLDEDLRPYTYWPQTGNPKLDDPSRAMVLAFGYDNIIIQDAHSIDPRNSHYLSDDALANAKPAIIAEAGYAGTVKPEDVDGLVRGCLGVMRELKMLPGTVAPVEHPVWYSQVITLTSHHDGIFYPLVKKRSYLQAGMKVGYITDFFGHTIEEIRAPISGVALFVCAVPSMKTGDNIIDIGQIASQAP